METLIAMAQAYVQSTLSHRYLTIQVWRFKDAHPSFRALSTNSGDEDWLVYVPTPMKNEYIDFIETNGPEDIGPQRIDLGDFGLIYITSHS